MWPILQNSGILVSWWVGIGVALVLGVSFYWWRMLRIDCDEEEILGGVFWLAIAVTIGVVTVGKIPGMGLGVGWVFGLMFWGYWCKKNKWDFWEWTDIIIPSGLVVGIIVNLAIGPERWKYMVGYFAVLLFTLWTGKKYRKIKWYLSGRPGFVGLSGLMTWSAVEIGVEIWQGKGIYLLGLTIEQWLATWILVTCGVTLYLRSGRSLTKDLNFIKIK